MHFGSPFRLPVEDLFRVISLLSCGVDNIINGDKRESEDDVEKSHKISIDSGKNSGCAMNFSRGGIETLILDVDLNMHDILDELFPPATKAWKNLRRIQIMSSWTDVEQLMAHLYKNGYVICQ